MAATATKVALRPLHDRLIVERIEETEQKVGGIIIPDSAKEKPQQGRVIAVGAGKADKDGKRIPLVMTEPITIEAFDESSACRKTCVVPRCGDGVLTEVETAYQYVQVTEYAGLRSLRFDEGNFIQSQERASTPFTDSYVDAFFMLPALSTAPKPKVL